MKDKTKAYLAGLFDAEGSFTIYRHIQNGGWHYVSQSRIYNTDRRLMKWLVKHFGGYFQLIRKEDQYKPEWAWTISSQKQGLRLLPLAIPYMKIKIQRAKLMLEYYSLLGQKLPEEREKFRLEMVRLNDTESSVTTETLDFPYHKNLINAYIAGLLDGEGCINIYRQKKDWGYHYYSKITITNEFRPVLNAVAKLYGVKTAEQSNKDCFDVIFSRQADQARFLLRMLPYLVIKKDQANVLLRFIRLDGAENPTERERLYKLIRKFNGKMIQSKLMGDHESDSAET